MSEFHDVLSSTYGDKRTQLVDKAIAPYELEVLRQWRASAATEVANLQVAAGSVEVIPQPQQPVEDFENWGQSGVDGNVAVYSRP